MGAVLVADGHRAPDLAEGDHTVFVVGLRQERVHALQHPTADRGGVAKPHRRPDHDDVGGHDLLADRRPLIARALRFRRHPRVDVVGGHADVRSGHPVARQLLQELVDQQLGAGLPLGLEGAVEGEAGQVSRHALGLPDSGQRPNMPPPPAPCQVPDAGAPEVDRAPTRWRTEAGHTRPPRRSPQVAGPVAPHTLEGS